MATSSVLMEIGRIPVPASAPAPSGPALVVRRCRPEEGDAYWRWDCRRCGEYGGGRSHPDAITRAGRHCAEHPQHRSSLLPPVRCRERNLAVHPALFAPIDEREAGPAPLDV